MAVTLKDVARQAKVSHTAASYVLNNKNLKSVSDEKRKRVLKAMQDLNYRPHAGARSMVQQRFGTIGMFFGSASLNTFRIHSDLIAGVNEKLVEHEYNMIFHLSSREEGPKNGLPKMFYEHNIDGIIILSSTNDDAVQQIRDMNIPAVFVNCNQWDNVDCIKPDDLGGAYTATKHLIDLGHKRIAHVEPIPEDSSGHPAAGHPSAVERSQGYKKAMKEAGLEELPFIKVPSHDKAGCYHEIMSGKNRPTAFVGNSMGNVIQLNQVALGMGLRVGKDVSLIGGDNGAANDVRFLDYVHIPFWEMGVRGAELLFKKLENHGPVPSEMVSERLVLRGSSGSPEDN